MSSHLLPTIAPPALPTWSLNPFDWLGDKAAEIGTGAIQALMIAIWSASMWILGFAMKISDFFQRPDVSTNGPLNDVMPITLGISLTLLSVLTVMQIIQVVAQASGKTAAHLVMGIVGYLLAWTLIPLVWGMVLVGAAAITTGILNHTLHINSFAEYTTAANFPRAVSDMVMSVVLAFCSFFFTVPGSYGHVGTDLTRLLAIYVLYATSPIAAAGLVNIKTTTWFWRMNRWFFAAAFTSPLKALMLGMGNLIINATVFGHKGDDVTSVGAAIVGSLLVFISCTCPLALFRLLAFVDPGTTSGANFRAGLAANSHVFKALKWGKHGSTSTAASRSTQQGASSNEKALDEAAESRMDKMQNLLIKTNSRIMGGIAAAGIQGSDNLTQMPVGDQQYLYGASPQGFPISETKPQDNQESDTKPAPHPSPTPPEPVPPAPTPSPQGDPPPALPSGQRANTLPTPPTAPHAVEGAPTTAGELPSAPHEPHVWPIANPMPAPAGPAYAQAAMPGSPSSEQDATWSQESAPAYTMSDGHTWGSPRPQVREPSPSTHAPWDEPRPIPLNGDTVRLDAGPPAPPPPPGGSWSRPSVPVHGTVVFHPDIDANEPELVGAAKGKGA